LGIPYDVVPLTITAYQTYEKCDLQFFIGYSTLEDGIIALSRNVGHSHPMTGRNIPEEREAHTNSTRDTVFVRHMSQHMQNREFGRKILFDISVHGCSWGGIS